MTVSPKGRSFKRTEIAVWFSLALAVLVSSHEGLLQNLRTIPVLVSGSATHDFVQDWAGARALLSNGYPYPNLGPLFAQLGAPGQANHSSTHPPTAFLLALPFGLLPWSLASATWVVTMFVCLALTAWVFGARASFAVVSAALSLLWPPVLWSLIQLTPIWLLGTAVAWRYRQRPRTAGMAIGLASLTKILPALSILVFVRERRWQAIQGLCLTLGLAVLVLFALRADAVPLYLNVMKVESVNQTLRPDNGAFLLIAWRFGGWLGAGAAVGLLTAVCYAAWFRHVDDRDRWACWAWVSVAVLPIAWVYSLLPLFPWLVRSFCVGNVGVRIFSGAALLFPFAGPRVSENPRSVAASIAFAALAFVMTDPKRDPTIGPTTEQDGQDAGLIA